MQEVVGACGDVADRCLTQVPITPATTSFKDYFGSFFVGASLLARFASKLAPTCVNVIQNFTFTPIIPSSPLLSSSSPFW